MCDVHIPRTYMYNVHVLGTYMSSCASILKGRVHPYNHRVQYAPRTYMCDVYVPRMYMYNTYLLGTYASLGASILGMKTCLPKDVGSCSRP